MLNKMVAQLVNQVNYIAHASQNKELN